MGLIFCRTRARWAFNPSPIHVLGVFNPLEAAIVGAVRFPRWLINSQVQLSNFLCPGLMLAVQGLPTSGWGDSEIAELLAKAFMLRSTYTVKDVEAGHWTQQRTNINDFCTLLLLNSPLTTWENWRIMYRSDVQFKPNLVSFFCYEFCQACVFFKSRNILVYITTKPKNNTITIWGAL